MKTDCKSCRVALTITIISFVAMFGSCVACVSSQNKGDARVDYYRGSDGQIKESVDRGVTDNERIFGIVTISAFLVGFVGSLGVLFACSEKQGEVTTEFKNQTNSMTLPELESRLKNLKTYRKAYTNAEQAQKYGSRIYDEKKRQEAAKLDEEIKIVEKLIGEK